MQVLARACQQKKYVIKARRAAAARILRACDVNHCDGTKAARAAHLRSASTESRAKVKVTQVCALPERVFQPGNCTALVRQLPIAFLRID